MGAIRNVLLLTFDQWRADCLSLFGHPILRTPKLDEFAKDAVAFRNHYSVTCPCGPGRASLLTGTYLHKHRSLRNGTPLDARFTNVALEARKANYDPVLLGYTDISHDPRGRNTRDPVFDSYEGVLPGMTRVCRLDDDFGEWFNDLAAKGYDLPKNAWDIFRPVENYPGAADKPYGYAPPPFKAEDSNAAFLTNRTIDYIDSRMGKPWFAHVTYISPHPPFVAAEPYNAMYDAEDCPAPVRAENPVTEGSIHPYLDYRVNHFGKGTNAGVLTHVGRDPDVKKLSDIELAQVRATYYGMINEVEDCFARIVDHLKATGAYDDTMIVLTSDHGEQLGDHWLLSKTGFFDESYHIPLIIRDPREEANAARGRIVDAFTESVDVMPTILEGLGLPVPRQCDGFPLTAFLKGSEPKSWREHVHVEYDFGDPMVGEAERLLDLRTDECGLAFIRDHRFKYVHFSNLPPLLYDLEKDPGQLVNVAGDPAYREIVVEYAQAMLSWRMRSEVNDLSYMHIQDGVTEKADDRYTRL